MPSKLSAKTPKTASWQFEAIGTTWEITTEPALTLAQQQTVTDVISSFDATYSRFKPDSLVTRISHAAGTYHFPETFGKLFDIYEQLYEATTGQVTPLIGNTLSDLGYDASYSLQPKATVAKPLPLSAVARNGNTITTKKPLLLDFGAVGKGYLADLVAQQLRAWRMQFVIDASGDICVSDSWHQRIGLEHPHNPELAIGFVDIQGQSICGSAINRRAWRNDLHHIIDPHTQKPTNAVTATWAIAPSTAMADGLSTALFFVPPEKLSMFTFSFVRVMHDNSIEYSTNLNGELFV